MIFSSFIYLYIEIKIFSEQLKEINKAEIEFVNFKKFKDVVKTNINKNYLLLTIDDAFESFYLNAWPILEQKKIPFMLFVSTREIGKYGIREIPEFPNSLIPYFPISLFP